MALAGLAFSVSPEDSLATSAKKEAPPPSSPVTSWRKSANKGALPPSSPVTSWLETLEGRPGLQLGALALQLFGFLRLLLDGAEFFHLGKVCFGRCSACCRRREESWMPDDLRHVVSYKATGGSKVHVMQCQHLRHLSDEEMKQLRLPACSDCCRGYKKELSRVKGA